MGRYRVPDNAVFRRGSGRGIARLEYPKSDEWDPAKINQAVNMVSNINNAATGILGAKPLDLIVSGIARATKDDDPIQTGVRRAATARMRAQRDTGEQAQEQKAPQPTPQPTTPTEPARPQAQEGMDLTSLGSFGAARRYARSGIPGGGLKTFRWNGKLYSTVGYQPQTSERPAVENIVLESQADWDAARARSRDPIHYPDGQGAPVPQPAAPEPTPTQKVDPVAIAGLFEQYDVNTEDGVEGLKEAIASTLNFVIKRPYEAFDKEVHDSVAKDQAMLEAYTQQQAAQPQQEVVQEQVTEQVTGEQDRPTGQDDYQYQEPAYVTEARQRQEARRREMRRRAPVDRTEDREMRISSAVSLLREGRIPLPEQLPNNVEDIASIAMVVTERQALPNLVRAARDSAMPTSLADLFTGNHERRAAKTVMDSFVKGEGKRTSSADVTKLIQNEQRLRMQARRIRDQARNVDSQIERRKLQNEFTTVKTRLKQIELNKKLRVRIRNSPSSQTIEQLMLGENRDNVSAVMGDIFRTDGGLVANPISQEAAKVRLSKIRRMFESKKFRAKLKRNGITDSQIQDYFSTVLKPAARYKAVSGARKGAADVAKMHADMRPYVKGGVVLWDDRRKMYVPSGTREERNNKLNNIESQIKTLEAKFVNRDFGTTEESNAAAQSLKILKGKRHLYENHLAEIARANNALHDEKKRESRAKGQ